MAVVQRIASGNPISVYPKEGTLLRPEISTIVYQNVDASSPGLLTPSPIQEYKTIDLVNWGDNYFEINFDEWEKSKGINSNIAAYLLPTTEIYSLTIMPKSAEIIPQDDFTFSLGFSNKEDLGATLFAWGIRENVVVSNFIQNKVNTNMLTYVVFYYSDEVAFSYLKKNYNIQISIGTEKPLVFTPSRIKRYSVTPDEPLRGTVRTPDKLIYSTGTIQRNSMYFSLRDSFYAKGKIATFQDVAVAGLPVSTILDCYAKITEPSGSKSPDNPGRMERTAAVGAYHRGRNFNSQPMETGSINSTTGLPNTGVGVRSAGLIPLPGGITYAMQNDKGYANVVHFYDADGAYISYINLGADIAFTPPTNTRFVRIRSSVSSGQEIDTSVRYQIGVGTSLHDIQPYTGQDITIPIGQEVGGLESAPDYIDFARKVLVLNVVYGVVDGTTIKYMSGSAEYDNTIRLLIPMPFISAANETVTWSDKLPWNSGDGDFEHFRKAGTLSGSFYAYINKSRFASTSLTDINAWAQANPILITAKLATPIEIPLSDAALAELARLVTYVGTNNFYQSAGDITVSVGGNLSEEGSIEGPVDEEGINGIYEYKFTPSNPFKQMMLVHEGDITCTHLRKTTLTQSSIQGITCVSLTSATAYISLKLPFPTLDEVMRWKAEQNSLGTPISIVAQMFDITEEYYSPVYSILAESRINTLKTNGTNIVLNYFVEDAAPPIDPNQPVHSYASKLLQHLYYRKLPEVYRRSDIDVELALYRYLNALVDGGFNYVLQDTENLLNLIDPVLCPAEFFPYLYESYGLTYYPDIDISFQRKFLSNLGETIRRKGTYSGISYIVRTLTGLNVELSYFRGEHNGKEGRYLIITLLANSMTELEQMETSVVVVERFIKDFLPYYIDADVVSVVAMQLVQTKLYIGGFVAQSKSYIVGKP